MGKRATFWKSYIRESIYYFRHRKTIPSLLTILPGITNGDGSTNVCLVQRSADGYRFVLIDGENLYTAPVESFEAIVYRVRETLINAIPTSPRGA